MGEHSRQFPFREHVELLQTFLARRAEIVERIEALLNARDAPASLLQDAPLLSRRFEDCLFTLAAISPDQRRLRGRLQEAHWESGFRPRRMSGLHNDLVDPGEMMVRGFHLWRRTRWPGRNGRVRWAQTLFNVYVIRCLALLTMRLWDGGPDGAGDRLARAQAVLDELWRVAPSDQPVLVRDVRWLIPVAQSPTTDEMAGYFEVAERIAGSLSEADRIEIHKASVQMAGGHLRSQLRHYCLKQGVPIDESSLTLTARNSNALDFAMLVQGLVPLLEAYERACRSGDRVRRLELAGAICQGISPDPELFVIRVDLLGPYSMIEHLFVADGGRPGGVGTSVGRPGDGGPAGRGGRGAGTGADVAYTPLGWRHVQLLREYEALIGRTAPALYEDCPLFRPIEGAYSPYGVIYGFSSNLIEHMALKALEADAETRFSLEDVFAEAIAGPDRLAWVSGWRKLPHIDQEVQKSFEYPQRFAEEIFERIEQALGRRARGDGAKAVSRTGRVSIVAAEDGEAGATAWLAADIPVRYIRSSDPQLVAAQKAGAHEESRILRDRQEGMFLVSYRTPGGWVAISKDVLTEVLGAGRDVRVSGLPAAAAGVLRLMCLDLIGSFADCCADRSPRGHGGGMREGEGDERVSAQPA